MTPALNAIRDSFHNPFACLSHRANLNLPGITTAVPLSAQQREALDLMISNSPIALITGIPGSGKTHITKQAVNLVNKYQKSILVITHHANTLQEYQELGIEVIILNQYLDYQQKIYNWLRKKLTNPSLRFVDAYSFSDRLLDQLQKTDSLAKCLELVTANREGELEDYLKEKLPNIPQTRLKLLCYRLCHSSELLQQRISLLNYYRGLSEQSFNQLVTTMIQTATIPILGTFTDIFETELRFQKFDFVLVDDAHYFNQEELQKIARMANKLVLVSEVDGIRKSNKADFFTLVDNTFPAYKVKLSENFRLHPQLAYKVFNYFYGFYPYSPLQRYSSITNRLCWFDATTHQVILQQVLSFLNNYSRIKINALIFSTQSKNYWESRMLSVDKVLININYIKEFVAKECDVMVIIFDDVIPTYDQLRLLFTRAKEIIACFGDRNFYEKQATSPLRPLFLANLFHIIRDVSL